MILGDEAMGSSLWMISDEYVLRFHVPTAPVLIFLLTYLHRDVSTWGGVITIHGL
jgi:hypothetical protein